jgi:hypothetical protein
MVISEFPDPDIPLHIVFTHPPSPYVTINPSKTTIGGRTKGIVNKLMIIFFPLNSYLANKKLIGTPNSKQIVVDKNACKSVSLPKKIQLVESVIEEINILKVKPESEVKANWITLIMGIKKKERRNERRAMIANMKINLFEYVSKFIFFLKF